MISWVEHENTFMTSMLHMKQLNSKKTRFPRFDKILVIQPIAEVYGGGNERQLC